MQRRACTSSKLTWCYMAGPISQRASCQSLVECACGVPTTPREQHNQWGKGTMFHLPYALFICSDLYPLMFSVSGCKGLLAVGRGKRVEYTHVKVGFLISTTPEAICRMSSLAPSSVIAEAPVRVSPESGCRVGSMQTSLHTSNSQPPTVSRTSLWRMEGKPPLGQLLSHHVKKQGGSLVYFITCHVM